MLEKIFYGGKIITMAKENAEAVLIKDGLIYAVGNEKDVMTQASENAEKIDLAGKCLMPSFIDGHSHLTQFSQSLTSVNLNSSKTFDDIINTLKQFKEETNCQKGEWIVGFGYDHNSLKEKIHPSKEILDKAFPENPVIISHVSGHVAVANSLGLKEANLTDNSPEISGGVLGRDNEGHLNGYLEENAFMTFRKYVPMPTKEKTLELMKKAQRIYLSYGITTIQDGMLDNDSFDYLKTSAEKGDLICDVVGYADMKNSHGLFENNTDFDRKYKNNFKLNGYKIFLDGSPQGRTAWLREPYLKTPEDSRENYSGYPIYKDEEVKAFVNKAVSEGRQLLCHCNGDAAALQYIHSFDKYTDTRPVIIHGQFLPREVLPEVKEKGLMPSYFVAHTYYWGDIHIKNMGMERAKNISPANSTEKLEIPFTFHQDTPVLPSDMIDTLWCAVNRTTKNGVKLNQEESLSVYDALKAITIYGAYQYSEENEKGTLEKGKKADMVILSESPLDVPKEELRRIKVEATYKNGEKLFEIK